MKNAREFENYKKTLNRNNIIMLAPAGSELLGLSDGKGDTDEMGITLETPKQLLGFAPFEQDQYRTAEDRTGNVNEKSKTGDIDLTLYGLRKFVRLALGGNPNVISMLFIPKNVCTIYTPTAKELQKLAPSFLSKNMAAAFLGYMQAQRLRLLGERGGRGVHRVDLEQAHGYDTKYAMHLLRLGLQGYQLMYEGNLSIPMSNSSIQMLRSVRQGEYSQEKILSYAQQYESSIKELLSENPQNLPERPDSAVVENWLLSTYARTWAEGVITKHEDTKTPQQHGVEANQAGQNTGTSKANRKEIEVELDMPF